MQNCPLLGPVFPAPLDPLSSTVVQTAQKAFSAVISQALSSGLLDNVTTSFSINVFSASDNQTLFNYHFAAPGLNGSLKSGSLDDSTIYRVGSTSKLLTAYTFLVQAGNKHFNSPITEFVTELRATSHNNDIDDMDWSQITVGALASHMAGIPRDYGVQDLALEDLDVTSIGLPPLNSSEQLVCGLSTNIAPCSRKDFLKEISLRHPITAPFRTPIYSNAGYVILAYALENIANKSFSDAFTASLVQPLHLSRTSLQGPPPNDTNIIVPFDAATSLWGADIGYESPAGGIYSSTTDLTSIGRSILQSSLLPRQLTNSWLKTQSSTSNPNNSVGAPWEIYHTQVPLSPTSNSTRLVNLYTKGGDIGLYSTLLALDADHNIGFTALVAGVNSYAQRNTLGSLLATTWVPALEAAAREEAEARFAGSYSSSLSTSSGSGSDNSSITLTVDDDRPGLGVGTWISRGVDFQQTLCMLFNITDPASYVSTRLYPTGLKSGNRIGFRAVFETLPYPEEEGILSAKCVTWFDVDSEVYGGVGLDEFILEVDRAGSAAGVEVRGLRKVLKRV